jgi:hypothetical protein
MKSPYTARRWLAALSAILFPLSSFASSTTESSPYRADFHLDQVYELAAKKGSHTELDVVPTVRLQGRVRGVGFVDARYNVRRNKTWTASMRKAGAESKDELDPVLLQGRLASGGAWAYAGKRIYPSAASIIGKELKVSFPGRAKGSRKTWQRVYTIRMTLDGSLVVKAKVSSIPKSAARRGACGAPSDSAPLSESVVAKGGQEMQMLEEDSGIVPAIAAEETPIPSELARVVTISTDADPEWYRKYGEQSNAVIASLINATEAIYNRQLGLRFRIVKQHVYTDSSPYTTTDSGMLLTAFTRNAENAANLGSNPITFHQDVDLKHLFTGKDLNGSVIGIAYIGVLCAVPSLSFGVTQSYMEAANAGIFAHELGHNFGATHDSSNREGLMYPSISIPPATKFSDVSLGDITSHLSKYGSCISLEQMAPRTNITPGEVPNIPLPPALSSATLNLKRSRVGDKYDPVVKLSGSLVAQSGTPISSVGINLLVSDENVGKAVTDSDGNFEFFVKMQLPRGHKVYAYVETEGGEISSNYIWLSRTIPAQLSRGRGARRS